MQRKLGILFLGCAVLGLGACEVGDEMEAQAWEEFEIAQEQRELHESTLPVDPVALSTERVVRTKEIELEADALTSSTWKSQGYLGSCTAGPAGPFVPIHSVSCQCKQLTKSCEDDSCGDCSTPVETTCASDSYLRQGSPFYTGCRLSDLDYCEDFCRDAPACEPGCFE